MGRAGCGVTQSRPRCPGDGGGRAGTLFPVSPTVTVSGTITTDDEHGCVIKLEEGRSAAFHGVGATIALLHAASLTVLIFKSERVRSAGLTGGGSLASRATRQGMTGSPAEAN